MATVTSKQFSLGKWDWIKGMIVAVGTPVVYVIQELIPNWPLNAIEKAALSAFLTYIIKQWLTPSSITMKPASAEQVEAIKSGEAEVVVQNK